MSAPSATVPAYWAVVAALSLVRLARSRNKQHRGHLAGLVAVLLGCSPSHNDRESSSQSVAPPIVKIVDPIPTFDQGTLTISVGEGREIEARITPDTAIDRVELSLVDPPTVIGRRGHGPWRFFVPAWVIGEGGGSQVCIVAVDTYDRRSESCFQAIP